MKTLRYIILAVCSVFLLSPLLSFNTNTETVADTIPDDSATVETSESATSIVYHLDIDGPIGAVTNDLVDEVVETAEDNNAELVLITMNTPGGYSEATRRICSTILNSKVPVCVYIYPSGAHAGSAGVYITYSAHIAAMAHSTNIGSAHPVSGEGKQIDSIMNEKVTNDAVAQIKSYAQKRGRNVEWAEKAVRESVNITDMEALEMNVIDLRAENIDDLLNKLDGRKVETIDGEKTLSLKKRKVIPIELTFAQKILKIISDPNIIFILLGIASLGIMLELYNPGSILPGVVGVISLIVCLYGMQTLPINYAGLALILFAVILFIAEIKIVSHGLLTIGGLISLFLGGTMLVDTVDPNLQVSLSVLLTVVIMIGLCLAGALFLLIRDRRRKPYIGNEGLVGKTAEVRGAGMVYIEGALWKADSDEELNRGDKVRVTKVDKLRLTVKKI